MWQKARLVSLIEPRKHVFEPSPLNDAGFAVDEDTIFGHHANLHPATRQQGMESAVAVLVQQRFDLSGRFVPTLFEGSLAHVL